MSSKDDRSFIDFDRPHNQGVTIVVRYRGVVVSVTRERLLELLRREERFLTTAVDAEPEALAEASGFSPAAPQRRIERGVAEQVTSDTGVQTLGEGVTHGSLSGRIKKMYTYSVASKALRPMHAGFLAELLGSFDWEIPEHPRTQMVSQLTEIMQWDGVPPELKRQIQRFLDRYRQATGASK